MAKYTDDVKALLELIGGKENIAAVSHCMTRMRVSLYDKDEIRSCRRKESKRKGN